MKFSAVIFDLDGTIIDSEEAWGMAFVNVFKILGVNPKNDHPAVGGVSLKDNWKNLLVEYGIQTNKTLDELVILTYMEYEKLISMITLNDGFIEFIENLKDNNFPVALATSTKWELVDKIFDRFEIGDLFDIVTTSDEVINPKPDPEIFTVTADKLGVEREDCLVIEDSGAGVTAARRAGMKVIAITDDEDVTPEIEKADKIVGGFSDIKLKEIDLLF